MEVMLDVHLQEYTDAENEKQRPIMIHRAVFGSIERFFGILVENFAGAFPLWLAPVQVPVMQACCPSSSIELCSKFGIPCSTSCHAGSHPDHLP